MLIQGQASWESGSQAPAAHQQVASTSSPLAFDPFVFAARACELGASSGEVMVALFAYAIVQLIGRVIDGLHRRDPTSQRVVYGEEDREMLRNLHDHVSAGEKR